MAIYVSSQEGEIPDAKMPDGDAPKPNVHNSGDIFLLHPTCHLIAEPVNHSPHHHTHAISRHWMIELEQRNTRSRLRLQPVARRHLPNTRHSGSRSPAATPAGRHQATHAPLARYAPATSRASTAAAGSPTARPRVPTRCAHRCPPTRCAWCDRAPPAGTRRSGRAAAMLGACRRHAHARVDAMPSRQQRRQRGLSGAPRLPRREPRSCHPLSLARLRG